MSDSENLFRVTKHINTFIINKDCSMRVYDIIKLKEALDIRSVSGGFEIFDTENGRRAPGTIIYPDEGSAETTRDRIRAGTRPSNGSTVGPAATRGTPPELDDLNPRQQRQLRRSGSITIGGETFTKQEVDAHTERQRLNRNRSTRDADASRGTPQTTAGSDGTNVRSTFREKFRAVRRSLGTAGGIVLTVAMWNEIEETMAALYQAHANGQISNRQDYERAVASAFGAWVAVAAPAAISVLSTGGRAIVAALRRLNMASSVAMLAGGPLGVFAGVLKFVIWEAGTWVAAYYISNSEWAQKAVASMIFSRIGQTLFPIMDLGAQAVANVDNIIDRVINPDTSQTAADREERNVRRLAGGRTSLDPNDVASRRMGAEPPPENQPTTRRSNNPAAEPASRNEPTSSPQNPLVNPNLR